MEYQSLILFDGVCNLCNGFVNFLIVRDKGNRFQFGSLQSEKVKAILSHYNFSTENISTVILIEDNRLYSQSTAVLKIVRKLNGAWALMYAFIIIPKPIRDLLYKFVAKNRYKWFGKKDVCMIRPRD